MGPKISVDSATLMNKGLEVIEAHHLFGVPGERIDVLVHPQSLVHSLVEFVDGSTLAQMGLPDMRTTLAVGLGWPQRIESGVGGLDLLTQGRLAFDTPDTEAFPCPALDCPVVYPYAPNAVLIGFLFSFLGGLAGLFLLGQMKMVLILPGVVPHFFTGATAGVFGNSTGGRIQGGGSGGV